MDAHAWFDDVVPGLRADARFAADQFEFMQEAGDIVFIPAGGWYHQVLSLTDSASVSFNMIHELNIEVVMASVCKRTRASRQLGATACNRLRHLRPAWFDRTCCPEFLRDPSQFPHALPLDERLALVQTDVA